MSRAYLLLFVGVASAATCSSQMQNVTDGVRFSDDDPLEKYNVNDADDCCSACEDNADCVAWTFRAKLLQKFCYLHASRTLPTDPCSKCTAGVAAPPTPPAPTPSPPPTPPPPPGSVKNWVVIAAGSSSFKNYRHQADACHAYQIAKKNGVPEERIILMMEDDVAGASDNPFPGKLFNRPSKAGNPGVDVYNGCKPDYRGKDVTAQLFLDVLEGNADAVAGKGNGKVLASGPHDKIFVNFVDHGGALIVEFPNGPYLHASDLNAALKRMHKAKKYDRLVFYMEACQSGSMFEYDLLPTDINVFATTAADANEPSWGTYCPPQDKVNGKAIGSCLGDLYSVNWMEDSDTATGQARTLDSQYEFVKNETMSKSHVMEYGTVGTWDKTDHVRDYQSSTPGSSGTGAASTAWPAKDAVDARDIELLQDFYAYLRATDPVTKSATAKELLRVIDARERADRVFPAIANSVQQGMCDQLGASRGDVHACHKGMYAAVEQQCGRLNSYSLKFSKGLTDLCKCHTLQRIEAAIAEHCNQ